MRQRELELLETKTRLIAGLEFEVGLLKYIQHDTKRELKHMRSFVVTLNTSKLTESGVA